MDHRLVDTRFRPPPFMQTYMQNPMPQPIPHHMPYNVYPMMPVYPQHNMGIPPPMLNTSFLQPHHYENRQPNMQSNMYSPNYNYFNGTSYESNALYTNNSIQMDVRPIRPQAPLPVEAMNFKNNYDISNLTISTHEIGINNTSDVDYSPQDSIASTDSTKVSAIEQNFDEYLDEVAKCLNSSEITENKLHELTNLALKGCDIVEKITVLHRNRPCFNKIDVLCARLKQDITRSNSVLPNINSQGIAWTVKDFIFVFMRVLNAWIIMKGYVYNNSKGLNHIKSAFSADLLSSFSAWQDSTLAFTANLMKSFISLNNLMYNRSNGMQKQAEDENISNFPEENKHYFKTGTYDPLHMAETTINPNGGSEEDNSKVENYATEHKNPSHLMYDLPTTLINNSTRDGFDGKNEDPTASSTPIKRNLETNKIPPTWLNYDVRVLVDNLSEFSNNYDPRAPPEQLNKSFVDELNLLINRIMNMNHAEYFFDTRFASKYFPEFFAANQREFRDLRTIIQRCQVGAYKHIHEVIYDIKLIPFLVFLYLRDNIDPKLHACATLFHKELTNILKQPPLDKYEFNYVGGGQCN